MSALIPWTWPQDSLQIPPGLGLMTKVEGANATVSRREGKTFTAQFEFVAAAVPASQERRVVATDQDGDFWCQTIAMAAFFAGGTSTEWRPPARVVISDIRTGNPLTFGAPLDTSFLTANAEDATGLFGSPPPFGLRSTATLIQPFCFTRNGGISVVMTGLENNKPIPGETAIIQIAFIGWTEYAHASR